MADRLPRSHNGRKRCYASAATRNGRSDGQRFRRASSVHEVIAWGSLSLNEAVHGLADAEEPRYQGVKAFRGLKMLRQHVTRDGVLAEDTLGRLRNGEIAPVQPEMCGSGIADGEDKAFSPN